MEAAFVLFLLALYLLVWRGTKRGGGLERAWWQWAVLAAASFAVWAVALSRIPRP